MKTLRIKSLCILLALVLLTGLFPVLPGNAETVERQPKNFGVIADPHVYCESLIDIRSAAFQQQRFRNSKLMGESEALVKASLETIAARKASGEYAMDYLIVPGDLTFDGEKPSHQKLADMFRDFESETGIEVFVINGNHDVNSYGASSYTAVPGRRITARDRPDLLLTTPQDFKRIYADFGYNQADSVYVPEGGYGAGMLSYSVSLPGGYRLIAIDGCVYTADVTASGKNENQSDVAFAPGILAWALDETRAAKARGETVIGMTHGNVVEHFAFQAAVASSFILIDHEKIAYELADAGMHFIFTGHNHMNDVAAIVSGNNETFYDIETCGLTTYPHIYREAAFDNTGTQGHIRLRLDNSDCDAAGLVDIRGVSDDYTVIERPFKENYGKPMLYGGDIAAGVEFDAAEFVIDLLRTRLPGIIQRNLPDGLAGLLAASGIDLGRELTANSPAVASAVRASGLSERGFALFLESVIRQIDEQYILNTDKTMHLVNEAIRRLASFELVEGNPDTPLGRIVMLGMWGITSGNENPQDNPEFLAIIDTLRTQAGADRVIEELLDILVNDLLFDEILPSIRLEALDGVLPPALMRLLRTAAGDDLTVGGVLDALFDAAAGRVKNNPFVHIETGRDVVKALVYTIGYEYLNPNARLTLGAALADVITAFSHDDNPVFLGDSEVTLMYTGKTPVEPSAENYRLPADVSFAAGDEPGSVRITWRTIHGIIGSDAVFDTLPGTATIDAYSRDIIVKEPVLDFGFMALSKDRSLLEHAVVVRGLAMDTPYTVTVGDNEKGLMSTPKTFRLTQAGTLAFEEKPADFFTRLADFLLNAFGAVRFLLSILNYFPK